MYRPNKIFLRSLLILLLFFYQIAHAETNEPLQEGSQLQNEIQHLQAQISNANSKITALETALNTANQNINALQNSETLKLNHSIQSDTTNNISQRTANGHGR